MKRWIVAAAAGGVIAGAAGATYVALRRSEGESPRLRALRAMHQSLRRQFESHLGAERLLEQPELQAGDVTVGIRTPYLGNLISEVSRRYLDRVELDLAPNIHVKQSGEVKKDTFVGSIVLGEWKVDLDIQRLNATLSADTPEISVAEDNRVRVSVPIRCLAGRGAGRARFSWDSKHVANFVCKDFSVEESLEATALPDQYRVRGAFSFLQTGDNIVARPEFPPEKFHVRVDLLPESWQKVEAALRAQDTWDRCAAGIDPPEVLAKLRELAQTGFDFKLPRSLFRATVMPAQFRSRVDVQGAQVDVAVEPRALRLSADYLWYAARLRAHIVSAPPAARPRPSPTP